MARGAKEQVRRLGEIAGVLHRHGWGYLAQHLDLGRFLPLLRTPQPTKQALPETACAILLDLGPSYIKAGQLLSTRPDLIPEDYVKAFEELQDNNPPIPTEEVYAAIESELGEPPEQLFQQFHPDPVAAASLAQVHEACLHDGSHVAVKVQRPDVRHTIQVDIEIATKLATLLEERAAWARDYQITESVVSLGDMLMSELDFMREARNMQRLAENMAALPRIFVPAPIWDFTTPRILTEQFVGGIKVSHVEELRAAGHDTRDLANVLVEMVLRQIFVDGFFHADIHPGNLRVLEDGRIALLDFGSIGRFSDSARIDVTNLLLAFINADARQLSDHLIRISNASRIDRGALRAELERVVLRYGGASSGYADVPKLLQAALQIAFEHRLRLPAEFGLMVKCLVSADGICRQLDPQFELGPVAQAIVVDALRPDLNMHGVLPGLWAETMDLLDLVRRTPARVNDLLDQLVEGHIKSELNLRGLTQFARTLNNAGNRISCSLLTASLIIGSAMLVQSKVPPLIYGQSALGMAGFICAGCLAASLLATILRSRISDDD